jgi:hypothetical protein
MFRGNAFIGASLRERSDRMSEISLKGIFSLELIKKEPFQGSHDGMRFRLNRDGDQVMATVYPEPYCWEATPDEQKKTEVFSLTEEGLTEAVAWLNRIYREEYQK